ncbi:hypothetical protein ACJ2A9_21935 [Anaerobacillus sp. MEB173]|uniref:hypothetical protein n=1 Tax=Anaerobacillus sp. MEB173 TaxID=3383345 RepID=UPI003F9157D5
MLLKKLCANCNTLKDVTEFHKNKRNKDGLHSYCKECNYKKAQLFNKLKGKENIKKAKEKQINSGYFKYGKGAVINMSNSANKRGITFDLTESELQKWWKDTEDSCSYCGVNVEEYRELRDMILNYVGNDWHINRFKKFFKLENHSKINDMTIDRVDNSKGYSIKNIVKSCWLCNSQKSDFYTEDEIKVIGKVLLEKLRDIKKGLK